MPNEATNATSSLRELVASTKWYHTIELGPGIVTPGSYDHRPHLDQYGFPINMQGMKVLDVGRASGFFAFEFERRGADVCATELPFRSDKDFVGGDAVRAIRGAEKRVYEPGERSDFHIAHSALKSNVRSLYSNIYDLSPEKTNGELFDLVFLGSVLCHVANPMLALNAVRSITRGSIIIANPFEPERWQWRTTATFVGRRAQSMTLWWLPTIACLEEMLHAANFGEVKLVSKFNLTRRDRASSPHFVMHARADVQIDWNKTIQTAEPGYRNSAIRRFARRIARVVGVR